jgi:diguanylate cyclase (GGDEF)-like protein/PAS domain S-box-containing protein
VVPASCDGPAAPVEPEDSFPNMRAADRLLAPVSVIAPDSTLLYVNAAAAHSIGQEPAWLVGRRMLDLLHPDDRARIQRELRQVVSGRPSGGRTTYRLRADSSRGWQVFESIVDNLLDDPAVGGILVSSRDVTGQLAHERELYDAAYRDPLTGLPNRARISEQLGEVVDGESRLAVGLIGIDRFSLINDSLGHSTGDAVIRAVSARVRASLPPTSEIGRFEGDLLIVLIIGPAADDARKLLWRAVQWASDPLFVAGHELRLSLSAGFSDRNAASTAESLVRDAGLALRRAKAKGGGRVEPFESEMLESAMARLELEANLRTAVTRSDFTLALQPIVRLEDATPMCAEALVRWRDGSRLIPPIEFIPVAEETGLIIPLGDWIMERAAQIADRAPSGQVMVNLSARQLASPGLPDRIARILANEHLPASSLGFEITETLLIEHFDYTINVLRAIRQLGCRIGLDDFGTGYSSLSYLRRLPIDFLKIDESFTAAIDVDPRANAIIGAVITMADALGLDVVAEGVETQAQATALRQLGCTLAQGFLFAPPVEVD